MIHPEIELAQFLEHTCLAIATTVTTVEQTCWEADRYRFAAVCVPPVHLALAVNTLLKKPIEVWTVVGFPLGLDSPGAKLYAAQQLVEQGAQGLEVVPHLGWFKEGDPNRVYQELAEIVQATQVPVRAVLELSSVRPEDLKLALQVCGDSGVRGIKTVTGWEPISPDLVREVVSLTKGRLPIKCAGGIKTIAQSVQLILAGASRIGTSRSVDLLQQQAQRPS